MQKKNNEIINRLISFITSQKKNIIIFGIIFLTVFIVFFYLFFLGKFIFSNDEILNIKIARGGVEYILDYHKHLIDPPLERIILYPFTKIHFFSEEFILRLPYAIFALLTLFVVYLFTKKITGNKAYSVLSVILLSGIFYFFRYSQESRYYHMYGFFFIFSNYQFAKIIFYNENSRKEWIKLLIINILSFYLNVFTIFNIAIQLLTILLLWIFKKIKVNKLYCISYFFALFALSLPWIAYNDNIKIAIYSFFSFKSPTASILGGTDWLIPQQKINYFNFIFGTIRNIFVDNWSFLIFIILLVVSLIFIKKYRTIFYFLFFSSIANYLLFLLATIFLIPGVISDEGSCERRLVFLFPFLIILLIIGLCSLDKKKKYVFISLLAIFWIIQTYHAYGYISNPNPQPNFLHGVNSKKETRGISEITDYLNKYNKNNIIVLDEYSTGDAVLDYYLGKNNLRHQWLLPDKIYLSKENGLTLITYHDMRFNEISDNNNLGLVDQFGDYKIYSIKSETK